MVSADVGRLFVRPVSVSIAGHLLGQLVAWIALWPGAAALSVTDSPAAVPLEGAAVALSTLAAFLGHRHHVDRARYLSRTPDAIATAHAGLAPLVMALLYARFGLSVWLRLRSSDRPNSRSLRLARVGLNAAVPLFGWTQLLAGIYAHAGWARGGLQTAIVSHSIVRRTSPGRTDDQAGTALLIYGLALLVTTQTTVLWLKRPHERQSRLDARALIAVGCALALLARADSPGAIVYGVGLNITLDGHQNWGPADNVHVGLGVLLCAAGFVALYQSEVRPRFSECVPPTTLFAVGVVIIAHGEPTLPLLIMHLPFAIGLMLSSLARVLEIHLGGRVPMPGSRRWPLRDAWLLRPSLLILASLALCFGTEEPSEYMFRTLHGPADPIACGMLLSFVLALATVLIIVWALGLIALGNAGKGPQSPLPDDLDCSDLAESPGLYASLYEPR